MSDITLWGASLPPVEEPAPAPEHSVNPCIDAYGKGPEGTCCRTCVHLLRLEYHNKVYIKCELRKITHGAGSDHRAKWDACKRYQEGESTDDNRGYDTYDN